MNDLTTDDPPTLARWLLDRGQRVIVFDGAPGAGKTTLVKEIARLLPRSIALDVDDFLSRGQDVFVAAIQFDELRNAILEATKTNLFVLIGTVCAREVVKRLNLAEAVFVYVRKQDDTNSSEALAEKYGEIDSDRPFEKEIEEYHKNYHPRRNADFRYVRREIFGD